MDKKDLKSQALLEKISSLVTNYENQIADLRVELTVSNQELEAVTSDRDNYKTLYESLRSEDDINVEAQEAN